MKKIFRLIFSIVLVILIINIYIIIKTRNEILNEITIKNETADCIIVLGASIVNNRPSQMLEDRLLVTIDLYNQKIAPKILVSGDHQNNDYDEVNVMKNYLIEHGVPSKDIFMDHYGISTYDSIYRAKKIYKAKKTIIVTQKYHLYRALYIANSLDLNSYGIKADKRDYFDQYKRDFREILARIKDFFKCIINPQSKYLGEVTPIKGNGDRTNKVQ